MASAPAKDIPAHVPADKVVTLDFFKRENTDVCPQEVMLPEIHRTLPPLTWCTNIFPGDQGGWLLTKVEDMHTVLRDPDNYTKNGMGKFAQSIGEDWLVIPTETDPPEHGEYRKALNPFFAPQKIARMRDELHERAIRLIDTFKDDGHCEFVDAFSAKFPIFIVLDLLGLPQERMPEFLEWEKNIFHTNDFELRTQSVRKVVDYLNEVIAERRADPGDDYISGIFDYEIDGRKWNDKEVFGHCFNLFIGGLDTVTSLLGNIFTYLAKNPDKQQELRDDPKKVVLAVEEFLRAFAPVSVFRIAAKEIEIHGQKILPGDYVGISTPIAGYDPDYYEDPQEVRFDRKAPHISLGFGIHKCLGMHLARMELQTALEHWLKLVPPFRVADGFEIQYHVGNITHVPKLELAWDV